MSCRPSCRRSQGRRGWLREAKRRLDAERAEQARPIPQPRAGAAEGGQAAAWKRSTGSSARANAAYEAYRARGVMKDGRRFGGPPKPYAPPETPAGKINLTDPRFAQRQDAARVGAGLQRPSGVHRGTDRDRGRGDGRLAGLRASRTDGQRDRGRARGGRDRASARTSWSRTPATGIRPRWTASSTAGSGC